MSGRTSLIFSRCSSFTKRRYLRSLKDPWAEVSTEHQSLKVFIANFSSLENYEELMRNPFLSQVCLPDTELCG